MIRRVLTIGTAAVVSGLAVGGAFIAGYAAASRPKSERLCRWCGRPL